MTALKIELTENIKNDYGQGVPAWAGNYNLSNTWAMPSSTIQAWGAMVNKISDNEVVVYVQYGSNNPDGFFARILFYELRYLVSNIVDLPNGHVQADFTFIGGKVTSRLTDYFYGGLDVKVTYKINGEVVGGFVGDTGQQVNETLSTKVVAINLAPSQYSNDISLQVITEYPGDPEDNNSMFVGARVYNTNPPSYIPMSTRKGGVWKNLNDNNGLIRIRKSGSWVNRSNEDSSTILQENKGHNRLRKIGKWLQLPKM